MIVIQVEADAEVKWGPIDVTRIGGPSEHLIYIEQDGDGHDDCISMTREQARQVSAALTQLLAL